MNTTSLNPIAAPLALAFSWLHRRPATAAAALARGATAWVARPQGRTVRCDAGTLWLTFDGEPEDLILEAGHSLRCTKGSRLAIHALEAAVYTLR